MERKLLNRTSMWKRMMFLGATSIFYMLICINQGWSTDMLQPTAFWSNLMAKVLVFTLCIGVAQYVDYRIYYRCSVMLYVISLVLTALLKTSYGLTINGVTGWLRIAGVDLQVVDILKLALVLVLAYIVQTFSECNNSKKILWRYMCGAGGLMAISLFAHGRDWQNATMIIAFTAAMIFLHNQKEILQRVVLSATVASEIVVIIRRLAYGISKESVIFSSCIVIMTGLVIYISLHTVRVGVEAGNIYGRVLAYGVALQFVIQFALSIVNMNIANSISYGGMGANSIVPGIAIVLSVERRNTERKKLAVTLFSNNQNK